MDTTQVTEAYLLGIKEGRASLKAHGVSIAQDELANLKSTIRGFAASSPVGQMLRGERDFWLNQIKHAS
jgi:hypothetical protein